ncbi:PAS domain-containing protein [Candidatus Phycosocius spiralis]|uniref:PAS domain-containing protein n=1 Tax=Candidatus Phycosocius spiralis TaxID=2815099 RepID=A0ABQ4PX74_9PROT|nr:PAS domain-containing protein [Candidatus Phycosocius spiralis]GIU67587.1 hypothetical protein PsB1_1741 [Candidatus Phycosocius spiralis]
MNYGALHPESQAFLSSWQALSDLGSHHGGDSVLTRDASTIIDRIFLAQRVGEGVFTFKTIGTELKFWTGRDLRDHEVCSLFHGPDQALVRALLESAMSAPGPALARAIAFGAGVGQRAEIELAFLPLIEKGVGDRVLGLFQPLSMDNKISKPVLRIALTSLSPPAPNMPIRQGLRLVRNESEC